MNEYRVSFAPYSLFCSALFAVFAVVAHIWFDPIKSGMALLFSVGMLCEYFFERERDLQERLRADLEAVWNKRVWDLRNEKSALIGELADLQIRTSHLAALEEENAILWQENRKLRPAPPINPGAWRGTILLDG
jgi:hypothetical protein